MKKSRKKLYIFLFGSVVLLWLVFMIRRHNSNNVDSVYFDENTFDNVSGAAVPLVPNIVHYVIFDRTIIDFVTYLSIKSVLKNHKPVSVFIHSNRDSFPDADNATSYWYTFSEAERRKVQIKFLARPTHVYGRMLSSIYHASDVARILVLRTWGGIYLDTDMLVLKSLDRFRHFEMALGWPLHEYIGSQILIANKHARFLRMWLNSYQRYYPTGWYYNAGQLPTENILKQFPFLVHRVPLLFGVHNLIQQLYPENFTWTEWKSYYSLHLLSRHEGAPAFLNETIIENLKSPFGQIARSILS